MKYFFKNIAQNSLPRAIILFVLGGAMWLPTLWQDNKIGIVLTTMGLTLLNSMLLMQYFCQSKETNLPSGFVATTYWVVMSALPFLHNAWQLQFVMLGILIAFTILLKMDFHHEATEEAFLATLILCTVAILPSIIYIGVIIIWGYLIAKQQMTWRVFFATLIAVSIRVILMVILHYMGWLESIWMENIPQLSWQLWLVFSAIVSLTYVVILLPLRNPNVAKGIVHTIYMLISITVGILWHCHILYPK